jgi:hypothetical protein
MRAAMGGATVALILCAAATGFAQPHVRVATGTAAASVVFPGRTITITDVQATDAGTGNMDALGFAFECEHGERAVCWANYVRGGVEVSCACTGAADYVEARVTASRVDSRPPDLSNCVATGVSGTARPPPATDWTCRTPRPPSDGTPRPPSLTRTVAATIRCNTEPYQCAYEGERAACWCREDGETHPRETTAYIALTGALLGAVDATVSHGSQFAMGSAGVEAGIVGRFGYANTSSQNGGTALALCLSGAFDGGGLGAGALLALRAQAGYWWRSAGAHMHSEVMVGLAAGLGEQRGGPLPSGYGFAAGTATIRHFTETPTSFMFGAELMYGGRGSGFDENLLALSLLLGVEL